MEIHLKPELEELIQQDVQRGCDRTVDEFAERAVLCFTNKMAWLAQNRLEMAGKIDEGCAAAQRGELLEGDAALFRLTELKRTRSDNPRRVMSRYQVTPQAAPISSTFGVS